jgi:hypothetical protein
MPADPSQVNATITSNIATNGRGAITATVLSSVLIAVTSWVYSYYSPLANTERVFNPMFYGTGAKCDGVTDDYASFLALKAPLR